STTTTYTLSLHDALPIYQEPGGEDVNPHRSEATRPVPRERGWAFRLLLEPAHPPVRVRLDDAELPGGRGHRGPQRRHRRHAAVRSEEHTSELQSQSNLVC